MVAKDGITQTDAVSQTFFFLKKRSREECHYNVVKFFMINIS